MAAQLAVGGRGDLALVGVEGVPCKFVVLSVCIRNNKADWVFEAELRRRYSRGFPYAWLASGSLMGMTVVPSLAGL